MHTVARHLFSWQNLIALQILPLFRAYHTQPLHGCTVCVCMHNHDQLHYSWVQGTADWCKYHYFCAPTLGTSVQSYRKLLHLTDCTDCSVEVERAWCINDLFHGACESAAWMALLHKDMNACPDYASSHWTCLFPRVCTIPLCDPLGMRP